MTEKESLKLFGENLKRVLEKSSMTQKELAEKSGLSTSTVSSYIKGERMPTFKAIMNIIYATDCYTSDLIKYCGKVE